MSQSRKIVVIWFGVAKTSVDDMRRALKSKQMQALNVHEKPLDLQETSRVKTEIHLCIDSSGEEWYTLTSMGWTHMGLS